MPEKRKLRELQRGEYFTLKPVPEPKESQVYIREEYDRSARKYWCQRWYDISDGKYLSGDREVYVGFTF